MGWVAFMSEGMGASPPMGGNTRPQTDMAVAAMPGRPAVPLMPATPGSSTASVQLHNLDDIHRAYGVGAALAASRHIETFLNFQLRDRESLGQTDYVLRQLGENPVTYDGQCFHLFVSLAPTGDSEGCAKKVMPTVYGNPAFPDDAWCRQYRADMALAVTLFDAMRDGRLMLAWQPIRSSEDPADILYHECLLRMVTAAGAVEPVSDTIEALERLGLVRALDRFVMAEAIRELRTDRTKRIGVNISAQSLVRDGWWAGLTEELSAQPPVAARLFVEITETAPVPSVTQALDLVAVLRRLGCRIVIDDFGAGHASIRQLLAFKPEVVKIDRFFVHFARASAEGFEALRHLIGLAGALGALPVVEGIETAAECAMAAKAGGLWQQGYHHGRPSIARPWGLTSGTGGQNQPGPDAAAQPDRRDSQPWPRVACAAGARLGIRA